MKIFKHAKHRLFERIGLAKRNGNVLKEQGKKLTGWKGGKRAYRMISFDIKGSVLLHAKGQLECLSLQLEI